MLVMSKKISERKIVVLLLSIALSLAVPAGRVYADQNTYLQNIVSGVPTAGGGISTIEDLVGAVQVHIYGIALSVSFIAIIFSGIKFITARGDPKAYMGAQRALTYSIIAFLIAVGAFAIRTIVLNTIGAPNLGP